MRRTVFALALAVADLAATANLAAGQEPGWTGRVLKLGEEREIMDATPIELRPYRPLHFYGNTVRRQYYRGTPLPSPRDVFDGARALLGSR